MRVIDVARELGLSTDWIRRLEREGRIPPARRDCNNHRRYRREDLERLRELLLRPRQNKRTAPETGGG